MIALETALDALRASWRAIVACLVVGSLCLIIGFWRGSEAEKSACRAARDAANVAAMKTDAAAKGRAAEDRVADAVRAAESERELVDAIRDIPDTVPGAMRVARGCVQLRQAGTREADLPGICRSGGGDGGQAGAVP